jgi:hypothetical protein
VKKLPLSISQGLRFSARGAQDEQMLDVVFSASRGVVASAKKNKLQIFGALPSPVRRMLFNNNDGSVYTLLANGDFRRGSVFIDGGYVPGQLIMMSPNSTYAVPHVFIAATKMTKYDGTSVSFWGISPPPAQALGINVVAGGTMDDLVGRRYKYRYITNTTSVSNLNATPSPPAAAPTGGGTVTVSGFVPSPSSNVTGIQVFGDVGKNGTYQLVGQKGNDSIPFIDVVPVSALGDVDLNNNAPPPRASLVAFFAGSAWLNDVNAPGRLWRSVPGQMESFTVSGFFPITEANDDIKYIAVVAGQLYIWTLKRLLRVVGADTTTPRFLPIAHIGAMHDRAVSVRRDRVEWFNDAGLYTFDGTQSQIMSDVSTLFTPTSTDARRVNITALDFAVVGGDDLNVWFAYADISGRHRQLVYDREARQWTESSTVFIAHDAEGVAVRHLAATESSTIVSVYNDDVNYEQMSWRTVDAEFANIAADGILQQRTYGLSRITNVGIEYASTVALTASVYVDDVLQATQTLAAASNRTWSYVTMAEAVGQRLSVGVVANAAGLSEIFAVEAFLEELGDDIGRFDSGEITLGRELVVPVELFVHLYALASQTVTITWYVDGTVTTPVLSVAVGAGSFVKRSLLVPKAGNTGRLVISSTGRFVPFKLHVGTITLGTQEIHDVDIPPAA